MLEADGKEPEEAIVDVGASETGAEDGGASSGASTRGLVMSKRKIFAIEWMPMEGNDASVAPGLVFDTAIRKGCSVA